MADEIRVSRIDVREGWVVFKAGEPAPPVEQLPLYLNDALQRWLVTNSELSVRAVLPILAGGNTVAIHVWFD